MRVAALQKFLRELAGPLGTLGLPSSAVAPLDACAGALEPFRDLDLATLADYLRRAEDYRRTGAVPLVDVPALGSVGTLARTVAEEVLALESADDAEATAVEQRLNQHRRELQTALVNMVKSFGLTVQCTETPHWPGLVRARKLVAELRSLLTGPESYREPAVAALTSRLVALGDAVLKSLAAELGMGTPRLKGAKLADEILAHVSGHRPPGTKAAKAGKPAVTRPDPGELIRVLKEKVRQVEADPYAVPDAEVKELMTRFKAFKVPEKKQIVSEVLGARVRTGEDAYLRIKGALIGVRQRLESQKA